MDILNPTQSLQTLLNGESKVPFLIHLTTRNHEIIKRKSMKLVDHLHPWVANGYPYLSIAIETTIGLWFSSRYHINCFPALLLFDEGEVLHRFMDHTPEQIVDVLKAYCWDSADAGNYRNAFIDEFEALVVLDNPKAKVGEVVQITHMRAYQASSSHHNSPLMWPYALKELRYKVTGSGRTFVVLESINRDRN